MAISVDFEVVLLNEEGRLERSQFGTLEELQEVYEVVGFAEGGRLRPELHGKPILSGLVGPMSGGFSNNGMHFTVRYESQSAYNLLSE